MSEIINGFLQINGLLVLAIALVLLTAWFVHALNILFTRILKSLAIYSAFIDFIWKQWGDYFND